MNPELLPLREVIDTHGLRAKKSLGQHFLLDTNLLAKIVRAAGDISQHEVIEIGPGPGGLTRAILAANPRHLTAIEKDARCLAALAPLTAAYANHLTLHEADALDVAITTLGAAPRMVIANLPYNVGTMLVVDWLKAVAQHGTAALTSLTVMLQQEVAARMVARVGDPAYGRLSVLMQQYADAAMMFEVPPGAFSPPPKVTSAILHARMLDAPREDVALASLEKVVAAAFGNRRKMLRQSLKSLGVDAVALCAAAEVPQTARAEACDLAAFARIARAYEKMR